MRLTQGGMHSLYPGVPWGQGKISSALSMGAPSAAEATRLGPETASGSGDYVAASALTEAYAVGRLYHDRRLTLRGAGRPDGAPVLRSGSGVRGAMEMSSVRMLTSSTVRRERARAK